MVFDEIICASDDERFMLEALKEAARAAEEGEVPVGAVIVKDGQIIAIIWWRPCEDHPLTRR